MNDKEGRFAGLGQNRGLMMGLRGYRFLPLDLVEGAGAFGRVR